MTQTKNKLSAPKQKLAFIISGSLVVVILLGIVFGLGGYTFLYGKGYSYLTNDPKACANCHIMKPQLESWSKSSHHAVAVCNDCHMPASFLGKWMTKGKNGFAHSFAFTTGQFKEPIQIKPKNSVILEQSCRHCHQALVEAIQTSGHRVNDISCVRCHRNVGHSL